ncbi:hypothetical protein, partial [Faecalibaculum rodentium]|uniref:hypothetical protein n=1 Tax=Faecalibaculum rodentium TaxID=1702221 RepID=UPI00260B09C6
GESSWSFPPDPYQCIKESGNVSHDLVFSGQFQAVFRNWSNADDGKKLLLKQKKPPDTNPEDDF